MSQQPKALRLAELCRSGALINNEWDEVADELTRLHAVELEAIALRAQVERLQSELEMRTDESARYRAVLDAKGVVIEEMRQEIERLQAVESGAKVELMRRDNLIDSLHGLCESYRTKVESLQAEVNEQARLNGMGAERELALMAKVEILQAASVEWSPAYTRGPARQSAPVAAVPALVPLSVLQYNQIPELCQIRPSLYESVVRAIEAAIAKINGLTVGDGAHSGALHCKKCHADRAKEGCRNQYRDCPFTGNAQPIKDTP